MLHILFGFIVMPKLRKNPEIKDKLGMEFVSGWDTFNVAQALSTPRAWSKRLEATPLGFLNADSEVLFKHTTLFDRILARFFWGLLIFSVFCMLLLTALHLLGVLD